MSKTAFLTAAFVFFASSAWAMPFIYSPPIIHPSNAVEVGIICEQDGYCYRRGRRPVARWVYGEGNFSSQYVGPAYYGNPRRHWIWWPFW